MEERFRNQKQSRYANILPSIVLRVEQEVGTDDCDTDRYHYHDDKHQQHEPKNIVDLVLPEWGEDKVPIHDAHIENNKWDNADQDAQK